MKTSKQILLIDDDVKFSLGMVALLRREGYSVTSSRSGKEGLVIAKELKPDLILCDMMMPPPDGIQVKLTLNENEGLSKIPFIFISAKTGKEDIEQTESLGAAAYISKPFDVEKFLDQIRSIFDEMDE